MPRRVQLAQRLVGGGGAGAAARRRAPPPVPRQVAARQLLACCSSAGARAHTRTRAGPAGHGRLPLPWARGSVRCPPPPFSCHPALRGTGQPGTWPVPGQACSPHAAFAVRRTPHARLLPFTHPRPCAAPPLPGGSACSPLCLAFEPKVLAAAAIQVAMDHYQMVLPPREEPPADGSEQSFAELMGVPREQLAGEARSTGGGGGLLGGVLGAPGGCGAGRHEQDPLLGGVADLVGGGLVLWWWSVWRGIRLLLRPLR